MLDSIQEIVNLSRLNDGCYLWVWDADASPPHIGLSVNGKYHSLRFTKKDKQSVLEVLEKVKRLPLSFLWIEFDECLLILDPDLAFASYSSCIEQNLSCLQPILDCFGLLNRSFILKDLLEYLESKDALLGSYSYRIRADWEGLALYTNRDVQANLDAAKQKLCLK